MYGIFLAARTLPPVTIRELRLALQDEWAATPQQLLDTLILSMGRRCETCLACLAVVGVNYGMFGDICRICEERLADMDIARKRLISVYEDANVRTMKHILIKKHSPAQTCLLDKLSDSKKDVRKSQKSDDSFVTASSEFSSADLSSVTSDEMELAKNIFDERKEFDTTEMDEKYGKPKDAPDVHDEEKNIDSDVDTERTISEPVLERQEGKVVEDDKKIAQSDTIINKKD
ncbi:hypothetical protein TNCV_2823181 [Trichonephila clavipes]|nr:hypothetical protein TNCV_2823181 [Trichonephila clavipes]